ncbi:MAG: ABC transporter substrate-binding protein [Thermoplasmata archaeon]|nr:ABC transporter substrate-binding protein [Thermoplasmata archaeon]
MTLSSEILAANGTSNVTATWNGGATSGLYFLNYSVGTATPVNGSTVDAWSNYTFTVRVGSGLGAAPIPVSAPMDRSLLRVEEFGSPGSVPVDPAVNYGGPIEEPIANVYQTLIAPNGSLSGTNSSDFVPVLAACVPGSSACSSMFNSSLVNGPNVTFVVNPGSRFYDPLSGQSWPVYPTDVLFSIARTLAFSVLPCPGCSPGWELAQSLLPSGNPLWDTGVHAPYNTTPARILGTMAINDSTNCPASAQTSFHGCVTFRADGGGTNWADFLSLVANPDGASIVPCAWASSSSNAAGLPYWTLGNVSGQGDHPCPYPGSTGYGVAPSSIPATAWDPYEFSQTIANSGIGAEMAGSGPYYLASISPGVSYTLSKNPAFAATPGCVWRGCPPTPGTYVPKVNVTWTSDGSAAENALAQGQIDVGTFTLANSSHLSEAIVAGSTHLRAVPGLAQSFYAFNLNFSVAAAANLTGRGFTAPGTIFTDLNLRQFLRYSEPWGSTNSQLWTRSGVPWQFHYDGVLPNFLGGVSIANVTGPSPTPDPDPADVGGAAWWWNRTAHDGLMGATCLVSSPCSFPLYYVDGDPSGQAETFQWANLSRNLSGGAIIPVPENISFVEMILNILFTPVGQSPISIYPLGWVPDYSSATDILQALFDTQLPAPTTYPYPDSLAAQLLPLNSSACSTTLSYWATLVAPIPQGCQGAAYASLSHSIVFAHAVGDRGAGPLLLNQIDQVAERLGLYLPEGGQKNLIETTAAWVDPSTLQSNPWLASGPTQQWWTVRFEPGPSTPLAVRGPLPSADPAPVSTPMTITAQGTGGAGNYSFAWSGLPTGCSTGGPVVSCLPSVDGNYTVSVRVGDSEGNRSTAYVLLQVTGAPLVVKQFTISPSPISLGSAVTLSTTVSGGTSPFRFEFTGLPSGCAGFGGGTSTNSSSLTCTPTEAGNFSVTVYANDSNGLSATSQAPLVVLGPSPTSVVIRSFSAVPAAVDVGDTVVFDLSVAPVGGNSNGTFVGVPGCSGTVPTEYYPMLTQFSCTPSVAGTFLETAFVNSTIALGATARTSLVVDPLPSVFQLNTSTGVGEVGVTVYVNTTVVGGSAPFAYGYSGLPPGCSSVNAPSLSCRPTQSGPYTIRVTIKDASNHTGSHTRPFEVYPRLSSTGGLGSPPATEVDLPVVIGFSGVSGGVPPIRYAYSGLPSDCPSMDSMQLNCTPGTPGTYLVTITATDAFGVSLTVTATITAIAGPPLSGGTLFDLGGAGTYVLIGAIVAVVAVVAVLAYRQRASRQRRDEGGGVDAPEAQVDENAGPPD